MLFDNPSDTDGPAHLGAGIAVGRVLVCVGGQFTSLPTGLITSALTSGAFGCTGAVVVGTVADQVGLLSDLTGLLDLPNLTGVGDTVSLVLPPGDTEHLDIIKLQALAGALGGSASTTGFGDTFDLQTPAAAPEPGSATLSIVGAGLFLTGYLRNRRRKMARQV